MAVIDADAHVVETERTWEYMEEAESPFKPEVVVAKAGGDREYWLIEGRAFAKNTNIGKDTPDEAREVSDIATRLAHMDELGVDVHMLYPSTFLRPLTRRPGVGKSRLVYEFLHAHHTQGWRILESSSVSKATPYLPVCDLLKAYCHLEDRDDLRTLRAKITGQILTLDEALQDTVPAVLALFEALPADSPFLSLDPLQRRRRTLEALKRILLHESQGQIASCGALDHQTQRGVSAGWPLGGGAPTRRAGGRARLPVPATWLADLGAVAPGREHGAPGVPSGRARSRPLPAGPRPRPRTRHAPPPGPLPPRPGDIVRHARPAGARPP
jgi:hypothetical protein